MGDATFSTYGVSTETMGRSLDSTGLKNSRLHVEVERLASLKSRSKTKMATTSSVDSLEIAQSRKSCSRSQPKQNTVSEAPAPH